MDLFHRDLGGEGRPPMVLLHGLLGSSRNWQTAGAGLAAEFHVFALDLRNHGASPHDEDMTYGAMAADVLEWMDERGLARVSLLGHSMGGKVAMLLACRHPERVERLVVVDIAPRAYKGERWRREFEALGGLDLARLKSRAEAEKLLEEAVPDWAFRKFLTTNLERTEAGRWRWIPNLPVLKAALPDLFPSPLGEGDRYAGPTLVVAGGRSHHVMPEDRDAFLRHFPSARIETISSAGHNPHMEAREDFVRRVSAFGAGTS